MCTAGSEAAATAAPPRVLNAVMENERVKLNGNTHPAAVAANDQGAVANDYPMTGLRLVLKRSSAQEAALKAYMDQQIDSHSANYHHWLTPDQFGAYGPAEADINALTFWLQSKGFVIEAVSSGRTFIEFSGPAAAVEDAFHTEIHSYLVNGERHIANSSDPSLPAALAPVVTGIDAMNDFHAKALHRDMGPVKRNPQSGKWVPTTATNSVDPLFSPTGSNGYELVSPNDFATIYNILPLWNAGIDGTGQTIAIAGRSDIKVADVASFRAAFGLPVNVPQIIINGADPGVPSLGDQVENTLDVEWAGAVAKGAKIIFVTSPSTLSDGAFSSAQYIVEHNTAPIMSFSYGACELAMGTAGNAAYNALWQQAAAEGISVFVASGDAGAATCDYGGPSPSTAKHGLAVSGASSTPYNVAVGGTDFNSLNFGYSSYWSNSSAAAPAAALQYIPEVPWNNSCGSLAYNKSIGSTDPEELCNTEMAGGRFLANIQVVAGGGGTSGCTTPGSALASSCGGGYAKPSWQAGVGVPTDPHRQVPDLALFAGNGMLQVAYVICDSTAAPCNYAVLNDAMAQAVGGTSVASPAMAGIMALVNQNMGSPQGNANVGFYALAAQDTRASCNSINLKAGNTCNFNDITTDSNSVPCAAGSPNCTVIHAGDTIGLLGYQSGVGYDRATGLGSVNGANLVNHWHLAGSTISEVKVPNVVGQTQTAAKAALSGAETALGSITLQTSTTTAQGSVVSQSPAAGATVNAGSAVNLIVSSGTPTVIVPSEVGSTPAAATMGFQSAGLVLGASSSQTSANVVKGLVISQSPPAGANAIRGSRVNVVISLGSPWVQAPNEVGSTQTQAVLDLMTRADVTIGAVTTATSSTVASGIVLSQSPVAGSTVAYGSKIGLVVSSGPAMVKAPNAVGLTQAAAGSALTSVGLAVGIVTQQTSPTVAAGLVISESPAAGMMVAAGSKVSLVVSHGRT
jgi:beta-lactam-binding protein with PASTA domain